MNNNFFQTTIAGINFRCNSSNIGAIDGYVKFDPTNEYDSTAIGIYNDKDELLGFIPKNLKREYYKFNKTKGKAYCMGIIYPFYTEDGRCMLAGDIIIKLSQEDFDDSDINYFKKEWDYHIKKYNNEKEQNQQILIEQNKSISKFKTYLYGFLGIILCFSIPPIGIWVLYLSYKQYKKSKLI